MTSWGDGVILLSKFEQRTIIYHVEHSSQSLVHDTSICVDNILCMFRFSYRSLSYIIIVNLHDWLLCTGRPTSLIHTL